MCHGRAKRPAQAEYLNPQADHILAWFHLTMRITVLRQCARGLAKARVYPDDTRTLDRRILPHVVSALPTFAGSDNSST